MSPPEAPPLEALSPAELRGLVGELIAEVDRLRAENRALRDEVARLKGLPPRPPPPPSRPSGMEEATGGGTGGARGRRSRRRRGAKRDREAVTAEVVVKAAPPPGSRLKGYQDILVRELTLSAEVVRYRRERWVTPAGGTVLAPLPAGGDRRRLRTGAAPLPARRTRPGPGDDRAAGGAADRDRDRDLEAADGAPADLAARRPDRRGPGGAARRPGHGALGHGGRHRRAARPAGRLHHPGRRRPLHRLPHRALEVARGVPVHPARRPRRIRRRRG